MTDIERQILLEYGTGKFSFQEFYRSFPVDIRYSKEYVIREVRSAIDSADSGNLELVIPLIWLSEPDKRFVDILNELLIIPNHRHHQFITKTIQELQSPSSIPFIRRALESKFDYLKYTCSDSDAIAKWFSWALYSIGTTEAIELMKEYTNSDDEGVKKEMVYRLSKVER